MSGHSYETICPICGEMASTNSNSKPFKYVDILCNNCGFYTTTKIGRLTLEEVLFEKKEYLENNDVEENSEEYNSALNEVTKNYNKYTQKDFDYL